MPALSHEPDLVADIRRRLDDVRERLRGAARSANGGGADITVVAITKTIPAATVAAAHAAGLRHFGENRVIEAEPKLAALAGLVPVPTWHLVGHLQRNKAKRALAAFDLVDSLDSPRLAEALDQLAAEAGHVVPVLLEVNVSGEAAKHGVGPGDAEEVARAVARLPHLRLEGLMTVGPLTDDRAAVLAAFQALAALRAQLAHRVPGPTWHRLSMGMSGDFDLAARAGATEVRLGRILFGD
jgi:PLP dependent protein